MEQTPTIVTAQETQKLSKFDTIVLSFVNHLCDKLKMIESEKRVSEPSELFSGLRGEIKNPDELPCLRDYLLYVVVEGEFELETVVLSAALIDRYLKNSKLGGLPVHMYRLCSTALYVAEKFLKDTEVWNLEGFSDIQGASIISLKKYEIQFLEGIDHRLYLSTKDFKKYKQLMLAGDF